MKGKLLVVTAMAAALCACATPDNVRLQADKIDRLERQLDDLGEKVEKVAETAKKAQETARNATEKADQAFQLLKR